MGSNPSARGVTSRYRYESHSLRFDVKRPSESEDEFRIRINLTVRDEDEQFSDSLLERYDQVARYSLLVSIHASEVELNLYTAIANQIETQVEIDA